MKSSVKVQQRKLNFTQRELNELLVAVKKRQRTILCGAAAGQDQWASAWRDVAKEVSLVEGIYRSDADVRKKWTYLKWEAINTTKPHRDITSNAVLNILTKEDGKRNKLSLLQRSTSLEECFSPKILSKDNVLPNIPHKKCTTPIKDDKDDNSPISIKWNTHASNMSTVIPMLQAEEKFVDVTLACDGRFIKCHKVILSACSDYFEKLLSCNPCPHPIILLRDFQFWEIEAIIDFIYKGVVDIPQCKLSQLLQAANALSIKGLMTDKKEDESALNENSIADCNSVQDELSVAAASTTSTITPTTVSSASEPKPGKRKAPPRTTNLNKPSYAEGSDTEDSCHKLPRHNVTCYEESSDTEDTCHKLLNPITIKEEIFHDSWAEENSSNSGQFEYIMFPDVTKSERGHHSLENSGEFTRECFTNSCSYS